MHDTYRMRKIVLTCVVVGLLVGVRPGRAQGRDGLLNGAVIGGAVGAGVGVAFTHAVRDSDLTVGQYGYGALVFGALGAGLGVGVDALFNRAPGRNVAPPRIVIAPAVRRYARGVAVKWRW